MIFNLIAFCPENLASIIMGITLKVRKNKFQQSLKSYADCFLGQTLLQKGCTITPDTINHVTGCVGVNVHTPWGHSKSMSLA